MPKIKKQKTKKMRLRFPPSPTGPLHIGNARTILFNYLFAKQNKGETVLRIEDTDKERSKLEWVQDIFDELKWLGIEWDEGPDIGGKFGPYKQSQRTDIYEKYLKYLLDKKIAYYCNCTSEELAAKRQDQQVRGLAPKYDGKCRGKNNTSGVIRFKIENKKISFEDLIRGKVEFDMSLVGDIVIAKNLQEPLYHFVVVIDDQEMQISHIIRGEDHLSNTPKHILLQEALGFYQPIYAHLPLMLNSDKSKMSKRAGDVTVMDYRKNGYLPEAVINFIALIGWNPGTRLRQGYYGGQDEKEFFSINELIKEFSIEKVQKGGAVFNLQKLDFINSHYIKQKPIKKLTELCRPYLSQKINYNEKELEKIIEIHKLRMKKLSEIGEMADYFFKENLEYDKNLLKWPRPRKIENRGSSMTYSSGKQMEEVDIKDSLNVLKESVNEIKKWDIKNIEKIFLKKSSEFNVQKNYPIENRGYLLWPLRVALSGKSASAGPFEIAEILGKEKTLQRIQEAIDKLLN